MEQSFFSLDNPAFLITLAVLLIALLLYIFRNSLFGQKETEEHTESSSQQDEILADDDTVVIAPKPSTVPKSTVGPEPDEADSKSKSIWLDEQEHASPDTEKDITTIEVFYGTDRKNTGETDPEDMYSGERSVDEDGDLDPLEYGICKVSIPPTHQVGEIESPKWWKFEFKADPEKHVVLHDVEVHPKDAFFEKMRGTVQKSARKEAFVFVHGYNVSFAEAAKRTAQIAFDLHFDGAPIMYSWPSRGSTAAYTIDEVNIQWTKINLQRFLLDIAAQSGAETIHLIAHSMGNRALTRAFADLSEEQGTRLGQQFKNVILTAPDIDADVFKREIAPAMCKSGAHITLYASSNDRALLASKKVHGYARAGDSGEQLVVVPGIETIDATDANTGLLGHSYFAESPDIITDIFKIMSVGEKAEVRAGLVQQTHMAGNYWTVAKTNIDLKSYLG